LAGSSLQCDTYITINRNEFDVYGEGRVLWAAFNWFETYLKEDVAEDRNRRTKRNDSFEGFGSFEM
jgi:hypothetical protein